MEGGRKGRLGRTQGEGREGRRAGGRKRFGELKRQPAARLDHLPLAQGELSRVS
jgi:hypothetical protein